MRALLDGSLDVAVDPRSLFDVPLSDEAAIEVEATRIRAVLRAADEAALPPTPPPRSRLRSAPSAAPDGGPLRADLESIEPELWTRRLDLDRARLAFYSLNADARAALLQAHVARQQAAQPRETDEERRARQAEAERQVALEAARAARTEAERLVAEELARLIATDERVLAARDGFRDAREQISLRRDAVLGWQRRIRDAKASGPADADAAYDAVRHSLRAARDDLSVALGALGAEDTEVPSLGPDALVDVPLEVTTQHVRERRAAVARAIAEARRDERALREERASALMDVTSALNRERLGLLPHLSPEKRAAITGFTLAGLDQARSEARHLSLILRYHQHVALEWLASLRSGGAAGVSPWRAAAFVVPLSLLALGFLWGRKRTQALLELLEARIGAADRAERRTSPSVARRVVRLLSRTHRPLEWIAFFTVAMWLLPRGARDLLEVQLLSAAVRWVLAGALVVNLINALASGSAGTTLSLEHDPAGRLRLRSLQLVGRTVVAFALILVLSARLVGEGTIYTWVFSTCWFAAVPVFLLLVRWWRGTVFDRFERARRKPRLHAWILANRSGWRSFLAAMIGALLLFGGGAVKTARRWVSGFDAARRMHAYLFRREIERLGEGHTRTEIISLAADALEQLHPEASYTRRLACPGDEVLERIRHRLSEGGGGLIAVIGARGMGKTSLLRALAEQEPGAITLACTSRTMLDELREAIGPRGPGASSSSPRGRALVFDDAHALARPCIGGLAAFDEATALARSGSGITSVFAIDSSVWPFLKRARDARPLFDEIHVLRPWNETQIGALLVDRSERAGISPSFEDFLERLPPGSDELDYQDAVEAKRAGYERMLWDHVGGNPGLALEAWRSSLGQDARGIVHVRPPQLPDVDALERLPDSSLFVLRAVLQLLPASVETVAEATRLRPEEVLQDLRFGQAQGYFSVGGGEVRVTWPWLRAATRLLERRHLLVHS